MMSGGRGGREGGEGREGQKLLSKPSADSYAVVRRQKWSVLRHKHITLEIDQ
jgi:hypothetical protein